MSEDAFMLSAALEWTVILDLLAMGDRVRVSLAGPSPKHYYILPLSSLVSWTNDLVFGPSLWPARCPFSLSLSWNFHVQSRRSHTSLPHIETFGVFLCLQKLITQMASWGLHSEFTPEKLDRAGTRSVFFLLVLSSLQLHGPFLSVLVCTHFAGHRVQPPVSKPLLLDPHGTTDKNLAGQVQGSVFEPRADQMTSYKSIVGFEKCNQAAVWVWKAGDTLDLLIDLLWSSSAEEKWETELWENFTGSNVQSEPQQVLEKILYLLILKRASKALDPHNVSLLLLQLSGIRLPRRDLLPPPPSHTHTCIHSLL